MMKLFTAVATGLFVSISGAGLGAAQAAPLGPGAPLSPASQQGAVRKAQDYLSLGGFSRVGLINQLVGFDQFSSEDATYAADSLNVNWNEQAAMKAKDYVSLMGFSRAGLIQQLVGFDQFTQAQAAYGASAVGL